MKLLAKILIIIAITALSLIAYFWIKPDIKAEKTEASVNLSDKTLNTENVPSEPQKSAPEPQLDGFSGLDAELEALSGSL